MLSFASICPHPPVMIPSIGGKEAFFVEKTANSMRKIEKKITDEGVDTVVIVSPHGNIFMDLMSVNVSENPYGNFSDFEDSTEMSFKTNADLAIYIKELSDSNNIPLQTVVSGLDHGVMVPMYFLSKNNPNIKIVHLTFSYLDYATHFSFGEVIFEAIENIPEKVAFIASGDLSHRLSKDSPAGFSPAGKKFDEYLIDCLEKDDVKSIIEMNSELAESAGECGLRSIMILLGVLSNTRYKFKKTSYEHPFGIGYLVGDFELV